MTADVLYQKLSGLKVLVLDVDGVMTDARVFYIEGTGWTRQFSVKDGYGMQLLMQTGVEIGIISGGDSESVRKRGEFLGVQHIYLGDKNKIEPYERIKRDVGVDDSQMAFVGDELFDIPVLEKVGFAATVPDAVPEVKAVVDYTTAEKGGFGAVREVVDLIRYAIESKDFAEFRAKYEKLQAHR